MKILFVVNELNFFLRNHLNLAASIGKLHDVLLIADTSKSSLQDIKSLAKLNITLHPLNRKESSSKLLSYLSFVVSLGVLVKRIKPSFIFYITLELSFFGSLISYFVKVKQSIFVVTGLGPFFFRKDLKYKFFNAILRCSFFLLSILKKNFMFVFLNNADQKLLNNKYYIHSAKSQLIHGEGIDESEFRFTSREEANIKFLLASRLVKSKGIEVFVSVAKDLKKSYPHIEFCLAGIFDSANPEAISKELFQEISESDHINFLGEVPHHQMEDCLHKHSVFVLTSEREGLPKAAAEAASTGMPLILSDVPGCRDCVKDNGSGMLVTYNNSHELYQAMELFINESNLIASMGKKSAIHAKEKFSLEVITQQYLKILQEN
tara:strand:+ start:1815 stop:2945 length:1131 start_codon:yes stop_codon:yes gene_type:complete